MIKAGKAKAEGEKFMLLDIFVFALLPVIFFLAVFPLFMRFLRSLFTLEMQVDRQLLEFWGGDHDG